MSDPFNVPPKKLGTLPPTPALIEFRQPGSAKFSRSLGVVPPDQGWEIHTNLDEERLQGVANRNIPMPYFMGHAKEIHEMARPGQPVRAMLVLGEPSTGKTYNLMATAKQYGDPMFFGCDGRRAEELFKQVRFSYSDGQPLEDRVNKVISEINGGSRKMDALSLSALRKLGDAFHEEEGKYAIDWSVVGQMGASKADGISPDKSSYTGIFDTVEQFMQAQGVAIQQKQMDVKYVDGPVIEAIKQKRPFVILDEFTRMQDYDNLLGVMEVFMGLKESHPLVDADGNAVPCKKGELPILLMTGNNLNDIGVTKMPDALRSRLKRMQIEMPENDAEKQMNWQHVIDTLITGLPLNTLIKASYGRDAEKAKQEADLLREFFVEYFTFAMTEEEQRLHPKWKQSMQLNWENVTEASEQLAKFFVGLKPYFDPKSPIYQQPIPGEDDPQPQGFVARRQAQRGQATPEPEERTPMNEIIKSSLRRMREPVQIDFRSFAMAVMDAATHKEQAAAGNNYGNWFLRHGGYLQYDKPKKREPIEKKFGVQLVSAIVKWRDEVLKNIDDPDAREGLRKLTDQHMANCHLIDHPSGLVKLVDVPLVDELLSIDPEKYRTVSDEAKLLKRAIVDKIEEKYPEMKDQVPSDFMSESSIEGLLRDAARHMGGLERKEMLVLNPRMTAQDLSTPLAKTVSYDAADSDAKRIVDVVKNRPDPLIDIETLLEGITLPAIGRKNFQRLWSQELSRAGIADSNDPAVEVAEGRSPTGLSLTTVGCKNMQGSACQLQIWRNSNNNTTLIVGDDIDPALKAKLEAPKTGLGITYVNRSDSDAEKKAREVIKGVLEGDDAKGSKRSLMLKAFFLRHKITWPDGKEPEPHHAQTLGNIGTARLAINNGTVPNPNNDVYADHHPFKNKPLNVEVAIPNVIMLKGIQK